MKLPKKQGVSSIVLLLAGFVGVTLLVAVGQKILPRKAIERQPEIFKADIDCAAFSTGSDCLKNSQCVWQNGGTQTCVGLGQGKCQGLPGCTWHKPQTTPCSGLNERQCRGMDGCALIKGETKSCASFDNARCAGTSGCFWQTREAHSCSGLKEGNCRITIGCNWHPSAGGYCYGSKGCDNLGKDDCRSYKDGCTWKEEKPGYCSGTYYEGNEGCGGSYTTDNRCEGNYIKESGVCSGEYESGSCFLRVATDSTSKLTAGPSDLVDKTTGRLNYHPRMDVSPTPKATPALSDSAEETADVLADLCRDRNVGDCCGENGQCVDYGGQLVCHGCPGDSDCEEGKGCVVFAKTTPPPLSSPFVSECDGKSTTDCCGENGHCVNLDGYFVCQGCPSNTACEQGLGCVAIVADRGSLKEDFEATKSEEEEFTCQFECKEIEDCDLQTEKLYPTQTCPHEEDIQLFCCGPGDQSDEILVECPDDYECIGVQTVRRLAQETGITVVFLYPDSGDGVLDYLWLDLCQRRQLIAMTHEDYDETRSLTCYPNCQFWCADLLYTRDVSAGTAQRVWDHEAVHNAQSAFDPQLAEHVGVEDEQTAIQMAYQGIIEGLAESVSCVGGTHYNHFRTLYTSLGDWAEAEGYYDVFESAAFGHYDDFLNLIDFYETANPYAVDAPLEHLLIQSGYANVTD